MVSMVFWECFACVNITEKTVLVQSVYANQCSLLSLHLVHTLVLCTKFNAQIGPG